MIVVLVLFGWLRWRTMQSSYERDSSRDLDGHRFQTLFGDSGEARTKTRGYRIAGR
jgi:hypothetical protein